MKLTPTVLEDEYLRLEPFTDALREPVRAALDVDPDAWSIMVSSAYGPAFDGWWDEAMAGLAAGTRIPFAIVRQGRVVGTTSYAEISERHRKLEIGSTFYHPDARGGPVNPACKRLMLGHAFDQGAVRCELVVDAVNARSRAAVLRLGAVEEGILRRHKITHTGRIRDTVVFSITDHDWPSVRARLDARLAG